MNLKKIGKVMTSNSVGTGPSSYKKKTKKNLPGRGLTKVEKHCFRVSLRLRSCDDKTVPIIRYDTALLT